MRGTITKNENGYTATMERNCKHSVEDVWAYLTENDKLKQWFAELNIEQLQVGGIITFDMGDGSFEQMEIIALDPLRLLQFTWDRDQVRFELQPTEDGCRLLFSEKLTVITEHTPRDLAGWHVCLDAILALLDGEGLPAHNVAWEIWYEQYRTAISKLS